MLKKLRNASSIAQHTLNDPRVAHLFIHQHEVVGSHLIPGLNIDVKSLEDSIKLNIELDEGTIVENPVQMCFGMMHREGIQKIIMNTKIGKKSKISIFAHCTFPNAVDVKHIMDADITIGEGANYSYFERHIHGNFGGIKALPKAKIQVMDSAIFSTEFELLKGRVGLIDIDYDVTCRKKSILDMMARINGRIDDVIKIKETGHLIGDYSRGVLTSRVAVRNNALAEVHSKLSASGSYARGHVDCKEIVQDNGKVSAVPIVEVSNPKAHITHEASLGSVDSKQLQTLMARGLKEDDATDLIINGLLS